MSQKWLGNIGNAVAHAQDSRRTIVSPHPEITLFCELGKNSTRVSRIIRKHAQSDKVHQSERQRMQSLHLDYASPTNTPNSLHTRPNLTGTKHSTETTLNTGTVHMPRIQIHIKTKSSRDKRSCWSLHIDLLHSCNQSIHPVISICSLTVLRYRIVNPFSS